MSLSDENKEVALGLLVEKSEKNLEQAIANAGLGYWDLVANRLYYSIFHAVTALMFKDQIKVKSHKGTSTQFGKYYVMTGRFSREDGILYSRLQTMREKADYQNTFVLSREEGEALIEKVSALQKKIVNALKN